MQSVNFKARETDLKLDAFVRVFGSEIGMFAYRGANSDVFSRQTVDDLQTRIAQALKDLIEGAKKVDIDVARSFMFLDSSITFPTVAGMPVRLAVNGTTTVALGLESEFDLISMMRDPKNAELRMKVSPMAVTQLTAAMTVDIAVAKTGIKMASTLHSSAATDFSASRMEGRGIEVRFDLPKSKITLVDFSSELLVIQKKTDAPEITKKIAINDEVV